MARVRTGSTMIRTGSSRVMQRQPPQRVATQTRRSSTQKEIGFIAESKKLEEAKSRKGRRKEEPLTINDIVQGVKDRNLQDAESGYVLTQAGVSAELKAMLTPELLSWFDNRVQDYRTLMAECQAKYKVELEKVKEKHGKDPIRYTRERLKLKAKVYPSWSWESQHATEEFKERQDTLAKAITGAKAKGVTGLSYDELYTMATTTKASAKKQAKEKGVSDEQLAAIRGEKVEALPVQVGVTFTPLTEVQPLRTIPATDEEVRKAEEAKAEAEARGWSCYAQLNDYKVTTNKGEVVLVTALDKKTAESKAVDAGYKVGWVTKKMSWETLEPRTVETGAYEIGLEDGTKFTMETHKDAQTGETVWAVPALQQYKDASGNYDFLRIVAEKPISDSALAHIFGADTLEWGKDANATLDKLKKHKTDEGYNLIEALATGDVTRQEAETVFGAETVAGAAGYVSLSKAIPLSESTVESPVAGKRTATESEMRTFQNATPLMDYALMAGDILVPFFYVARHWDDISVAERAGWIAADIALFVAPMAAAAVRGARGAVAAGRTARMIGAAKGVGRELVVMVKGPITTVMHPVATVKQAVTDVRSIMTNIFHPNKIPEAVLTTTEGTLRLKVTGATNLDDMMSARDKLMKLAAQGQTPIVELKDSAGKVVASMELTKAPLMREVKGGVVHTTPWGEQFRDALTVRLKPGMGVSEQGLFVSHEPLPRFAKQSAFNMPIEIGAIEPAKQVLSTKIGYNQVVNINLTKKLPANVIDDLARAKLIETPGQDLSPLVTKKVNQLVEVLRANGNAKAATTLQQTADAYKPIFRIISPDKVDDLVGTGKVYRGTLEMEAKLPVGAKVGTPSQVLFTHIGPEATRVELWLDKPLSAKQILRLKAEGLAEVIKQPFRTPLKIKPVEGAGLNQQQIKNLTSIIDAAGNAEVARNLERAYELARDSNRMAQIITRAGMGAAAYAPLRARGDMARAPGYAALARATAPLRQPGRAKAARETPRQRRAERKGRPTRSEAAGRAARAMRERKPERVERSERIERVDAPVKPLRPIRAEQAQQKPTKTPRAKSTIQLPKLKREPTVRTGQPLVTWRQGAYYVTIVSPFRATGNKPDVIYSRNRPPWAKKLTGKMSPQRTLRSIGKVPQLITLPMGATTARVKRGKILRFTPG